MRTILLFLFVGRIFAQQPRDPHIAYAYPAGGQRGTTFEVIVAGRGLNGPTNVYFSTSGLEAKIMDYSRPLVGKELMEARQQLRQLQEKKAFLSRGRRRNAPNTDNSTNAVWTADDERVLSQLRKKIMGANQPRNPEVAEPVTLEIAIASDAAPGTHQIRLRTAAGLTNPLNFEVGQLPEITEEAGAPDSRARFGRTSSSQPLRSGNENEMDITIPATLNGQIMPGGVDRFRFAARKGERLVLNVHARSLIPYFANAVPGWFQATLAVFDTHGKELAYQDDFLCNTDPALFFEVPSDGQYVIAIKDSIFRGREDFVYRLNIAPTPLITGIFPLGGKEGVRTTVALEGWNLPTNAIQVTSTSFCVTNRELPSNQISFALDTLPEITEREPNDSTAQAQTVTLPTIVNGRIERAGDVDIFVFEGRGGSEIVAEVQARRLGSPLDSLLHLADASGQTLARNDDFEDKGAGLVAHQADSYLRAKLPADGRYFIHLTDTQHKGGREFAYRLRISPPRPDFALRVVPSAINIHGRNGAPLTVYALRKDGFTNEIRLQLRDAPGLRLSETVIPANEEKITLKLFASREASEEPTPISLEGHCNDLTRPAIPADELMQAFAYHHLVPAQSLMVCVTRGPAMQARAAKRRAAANN